MDHLLKSKKESKKFKETGDSRYIYQNELDKACFQHYIAYGDFKDLLTRTASHEAFNIAKNPLYGGYQRGLASMVDKYSDKKSAFLAGKSDFGSDIKNKNMSNQELPKELRKTIIRKFEKLKVHSSFIHNIWGADLVDIQLKSKFILILFY